ncbi:phage shock protein PspC (stress-responsive transcriptional regulator) [Parabacteroides sp. PFB2-10]|uniref:PspC domain-containing protein n=1 Tax=Parabacteroides sp. PFB2-10 TaxID=1742405 RepID=UPI002473DD97|nr:PspC domain-containing protein [Parabacteroides sp. PFB2-10]MDH6311443.1 phage shock protein PspC (stress-responsive transcriptional regulator) [Parabacteroides sp. PFB2-10]MDL2244313.1 PspC domain-containing protein [Parabacteroides sp. OttesenSCG-928-J18]
MKKTLTVNLGGTVFHIDEDAYQLLEKYLSNLRIHFQKEEGADEIMNDFEQRISELLNDRIRLGYEVITLEHVEDVIKRMGKPEEIFGDDYTEERKEEFKAKAAPQVAAKKRLFRNPDDRIIGGVAGGLSAYLGWDPTAVRIALLLLMFFYYVTIPVYLIMWLVIPVARTATEKLQMRGESVTLENIGKTVTDGFENVSNNVNDYIQSGKPRTALQKIADAFVIVAGFLIKLLGIIIAIALIPPVAFMLIILVIVLFAIVIGLIGGGIGLLGGGVGLLGGGLGLLYSLFPFADWSSVSAYPEVTLIIATIAMILAIGIPLFALAHLLCAKIFKWKPMSTATKWILLILWFISTATTIVMGINFGWPIINNQGWHWNSYYPTQHIRFW